FSLKQIMFEVISAIGTVGLSTGITPELTVGSKLMLSLLMYVGRLGALSFALAFVEKSNSTTLTRPIGKIMIG
ncbi:MAG: potassium transporter TrkG, partial [Clostridia bacterium]